MNNRTLRARTLLAVSLSLMLVACKDEPREAPSATYARYNQLVIDGRSFEDDVVFHSKARRDEVDVVSRKRAKAPGQTIDEVRKMYLTFTQRLAKCAKLTLDKEEIDGDQAKLVYAVEDVCTDMSADTRLTVEMVYEDGWKIQSDVMHSKSK